MKKLLLFVIFFFGTIMAYAQTITAKSYIVMDLTGEVIAEKNADEPRPIASITKLMTSERASRLDPNEIITITTEDIKAAAGKRASALRAGMKFTRRELTELALINSDNVAAIALGRTAEGVEVTLPPRTQIVEASGLDPHNKSTARELAEYAVKLYNSDIAAISTKPVAQVGSIKAPNTNKFIDADGWKFYLSKTGYINAAGGCLVAITEMAGKVVAVVILGTPTISQRWIDLYNLRYNLEGNANFARPVVAKTPQRRVTNVTKKR